MSLNPKRVNVWLRVRELDKLEVVFDPGTETYGVRTKGDAGIMVFDSAAKANSYCLMLHLRVVDQRNRKMCSDWHGIVMDEGLCG